MLDFADPSSLLPGLRPVAWRGVTWWAIDVSHTVGRRIHATLYPGLDLKTHDDVGPIDGPIRISGLVIGDDYVQQAEALAAAFRAPGSATLMHPWRGPIDCVLLRPAEISFASDELRVARIEAEFDPTGDDALGGLAGGFLGGLVGGLFSSLSGLLGALGGMLSAAFGLASTVLSAVPLALAVYSFGVAAVGSVIAIAEGVAGAVAEAAELVPLVESGKAAFNAASAEPVRSTGAVAVASALTALPATLGAVFRPQPEPGVGPSAEAPPAVRSEPDPRRGAALMLSIAAAVAAQAQGTAAASPPVTATERLVYLAGEVAFVAEAVSLMAEIAFESRQDALAWQERSDGALAAAGRRAATLANEAPAPATALWQAIETARGRLAIDMSEVVGRLPAVIRITPPRASSWLLAQHYAGDDPKAVLPMLLDIRRRNRLRHPALLGAGPIEVLKP